MVVANENSVHSTDQVHPAGRACAIRLDFRHRFHPLENIARQIVLRQWQQVFDRRFGDQSPPDDRQVVPVASEQLPQNCDANIPPRSDPACSVRRNDESPRLSKSPSDSPAAPVLRRCSKQPVHPATGSLQHTIEIVLTRTTLIVDQLRDAETMNRDRRSVVQAVVINGNASVQRIGCECTLRLWALPAQASISGLDGSSARFIVS